MIEIKEEDIEVKAMARDSLDNDTLPYHVRITRHPTKYDLIDKKEAEQLKQQILQNQKLRELVEKHSKSNILEFSGLCNEILEESKNAQ